MATDDQMLRQLRAEAGTLRVAVYRDIPRVSGNPNESLAKA
jgi:hypothetical protein